MSVSPSKELTKQFYDWEVRGRGLYYAAYPSDLEPPFHPFGGHFLSAPYIDDGKRPSLVSKLMDKVRGSADDPVLTFYEPPQIELYPFEDTQPLHGYEVSFGKNSKPSVELMEQCLILFSGIREPISFEIIADRSRIVIQIIFRLAYSVFIYSQLKAYFPDASITVIDDTDNLVDYDTPTFYTIDYALKEEFMRPINCNRSHSDSLISFFGVCEHLTGKARAVMQILFNGTLNQWAKSMEQAVSDGGKGSFFIDAPEMPNLAKEKTSKPLFAVAVRVCAQHDSEAAALSLLEHLSIAITQASTSPFNSFTPINGTDYTIAQRLDDICLRQSHRSGMLLNVRELATFVHFPSVSLSKKLLGQQRTTKAAPIIWSCSRIVWAQIRIKVCPKKWE